MIEVLVALLIFSFVLLGVAVLVLAIIQSNAQSRHITDATNLAQARLEGMVNLPYATVASGVDANNPVRENGLPGGIYTRTWTVTAPTAGTKTVLVAVAWTDKEGTHSVNLRTTVSP